MDTISFPLFILAKDSGEIGSYSSLASIQRHLEAIDVENEEYEAWDADGLSLSLTVGPTKSAWLQILHTGRRLPETEFGEIRKRAKSFR